ncbi:hypothetical protein AVEN_69603-1 [Araneus ventricosus]|uniref:STPR domain-containing protein n=1 Tax=Araneus ventricosus TaxID=182803 RepID=A0A4Y2THV3_ARAVE|nr:hypothetical protein AVEN_69603-1 [Araneus ventricosus]
MAQRGQDRRAEETEEQRNSRLSDMSQRGQERRAEETEEQRKEITFWGERNVYAKTREDVLWGRTRYSTLCADRKNFVTVAEGATPQVTADKSGQCRLVGSVTGKANGATRAAPIIPIMGWRDPPRL